MILAIDYKIIAIVVVAVLVVFILIYVALKQYHRMNERIEKNQDIDPKLKKLDSLSQEQRDMFGLKRNEREENPEVVALWSGKEREKIDTSKELFTYSPESMPAEFNKTETQKAEPIEFDADDDDFALSENSVEGLPVIKYRKSMLAKVLLASDDVKENYTTIKNNLLSLIGVTAKMTFNEELFYHKDELIAKVNSRGNYVFLYLALDPKEFVNENYTMIDVSFEKKYENVPTLIKIKNLKNLNHALMLIKDLQIPYGKMVENDYNLKTIDQWELLRRGLLK